MSRLRISALAVAALLGLSLTISANAQTTRSAAMKQCNAQASAKHLMGRDRQTFMKACLSSPRSRHLALNSQQQRMKYCSAQAKARRLMGGDRSRYMSSCLRMR